jgi:hypothetical protein
MSLFVVIFTLFVLIPVIIGILRARKERKFIQRCEDNGTQEKDRG